MDKYKFQDVLCPFCKQSFMTRIYDDYDLIVKHNGLTLKGWYALCPKCDANVFVAENTFEGIDLSEYPEESITTKCILR